MPEAGESSEPGEPLRVDGWAYAAQLAEDLVVRGIWQTQVAIHTRVYGALHRPTAGLSMVPAALQSAITDLSYAGVSLGVRTAAAGLDLAARLGLGHALDRGPAGRMVRSGLNGVFGDRLIADRPTLAISMAVRHEAADLTADDYATAFPDAGGRVVVFLHGLGENESHWNHRRAQVGTTYAETLAEEGWTPVFVRANTGLPVMTNGELLSHLLAELVERWPVPITRLALVGHSMGGLIMRSACVHGGARHDPWTDRVRHVVTLGTPHHGAPLAAEAARTSDLLAKIPETAAIARVLDRRSAGISDLIRGLAHEVPAMPHARYHLVAGTVWANQSDHPVAAWIGDLLVRVPSAHGRHDDHDDLFPDAEILHIPGADHFDLLNHPDVSYALVEWLVD